MQTYACSLKLSVELYLPTIVLTTKYGDSLELEQGTLPLDPRQTAFVSVCDILFKTVLIFIV